MQIQVYTSCLPFGRVDVELRRVDTCGNLIRGKETKLIINALDANTLLHVAFQSDCESFVDSDALLIGNEGYIKLEISFDSEEKMTREIVFRAALVDDQNQIFDSEAVKLIKYRLELEDVCLTDDINKYDGVEGVHYTNNDSARIKVFYSVHDKHGLVTDPSSLAYFHSEVHSQFLFANGDRVQYVADNGQLVDITEVDCAIKRKHKEAEKIRVSKKVFEERKSELNTTGGKGIVKVSYRLHVFSTHQRLKELNLDGRKYTIELSHPLAAAVCIPPVRILTKYHRTKKEIAAANSPLSCIKEVKIKEEKIFIKKEPEAKKQNQAKAKREGLYKSDNIDNKINPNNVNHVLKQSMNDMTLCH